MKGDLGEADLDLEWAGAAAPQATLIYVYSRDVMDAVQYAIDQNLAPVISVSYGLCEPLTLRSDMLGMQSWARQANAQGITWVNASGDSGGADCLSGTSSNNAGLAVDSPANIPEVTGIGGTTFNEGSAQYWNATNNANGGSATSYIPESCLERQHVRQSGRGRRRRQHGLRPARRGRPAWAYRTTGPATFPISPWLPRRATMDTWSTPAASLRSMEERPPVRPPSRG